MGDPEDVLASRGLAAPAVRQVEQPASDDHRRHVAVVAPHEISRGVRAKGLAVAAREAPGDVAIAVPIEQRPNAVVVVGDEPVQRNHRAPMIVLPKSACPAPGKMPTSSATGAKPSSPAPHVGQDHRERQEAQRRHRPQRAGEHHHRERQALKRLRPLHIDRRRVRPVDPVAGELPDPHRRLAGAQRVVLRLARALKPGAWRRYRGA
jgi:hypothetical protein